jgi:hypothetical protein
VTAFFVSIPYATLSSFPNRTRILETANYRTVLLPFFRFRSASALGERVSESESRPGLAMWDPRCLLADLAVKVWYWYLAVPESVVAQ